MNTRQSEDEPLRRALIDVVESVRGLASRTRGICDLGANSGRAMEPLVQRARQLLRALDDATEIMSLFGSDAPSLKIAHEGITGGSEKIVIRCVSSVLESIGGADSAAGQDGSLAHERVDLRGLSWSIGIPELLSFLETINKSGSVHVTTFDETFTIVLHEGLVVHALSNASPHGCRLGDLLVSQGSTNFHELNTFLRSKVTAGGCIGEAVVTEGIVSHEQLQMALEAQVKLLFQRMFSAKDATFSFYDGRGNENLHKVKMNLTRLLLESSVEASEAEAEAKQSA